MFGSLIGSLNYVVVLIIVCAAALAAVVLYNLISVNLAERKKELATIKVLGFYDKEVYRYIFREIELLSLIGSGVGLLLGVPLHRFIILTVEMDQLMFIRTIAPRSYLLAVALTMLFTVVVCFAMRRHVRHISMVESMKAPEYLFTPAARQRTGKFIKASYKQHVFAEIIWYPDITGQAEPQLPEWVT